MIAFLRAEPSAFREAICAGNEGALKRVRDKSPNGMAVIGSVRALEQLGEDEGAPGRAGPHQALPGLVVQQRPVGAAAPQIVNHDMSVPPPLDGAAFDLPTPAKPPFKPVR